MTIAVEPVRLQSDAPPTTHPRLRRRARALLDELRSRVDEHGHTAVPVPELAAALGVSDRTIQRRVLDLAAAGLVAVDLQPGAGRRGVPNAYRLTPCPVGDCAHCHAHPGIGNDTIPGGDQT